MKKKKKDIFGTTKSLSTDLKILFVILVDSVSNFWHCVEGLSAFGVSDTFSISRVPSQTTVENIL